MGRPTKVDFSSTSYIDKCDKESFLETTRYVYSVKKVDLESPVLRLDAMYLTLSAVASVLMGCSDDTMKEHNIMDMHCTLFGVDTLADMKKKIGQKFDDVVMFRDDSLYIYGLSVPRVSDDGCKSGVSPTLVIIIVCVVVVIVAIVLVVFFLKKSSLRKEATSLLPS